MSSSSVRVAGRGHGPADEQVAGQPGGYGLPGVVDDAQPGAGGGAARGRSLRPARRVAVQARLLTTWVSVGRSG
ncbi:hypothetical protein [Streptomyces thioluteus]|uniref:hypothetical protein n=1 Tax=Streptomyces thioluteus TaxID=66431 RepID=UPI0031EBEE19